MIRNLNSPGDQESNTPPSENWDLFDETSPQSSNEDPTLETLEDVPVNGNHEQFPLKDNSEKLLGDLLSTAELETVPESQSIGEPEPAPVPGRRRFPILRLLLPLILGSIVIAGYFGWKWWETPQGLLKTLEVPSDRITTLAISADDAGAYLAAGTADGGIYLWGTATWEPIHPIPLKPEEPIHAVAISADGWLLVAVGKRLFAYDIPQKKWKQLPKFKVPISSIAFRPRRFEIAVGLVNGMLHFIDIRTTESESITSGHKDTVRSIAYSPDGKQLVTGGRDGQLIWRYAETKRLLRKVQGHTGDISGLVFAEEGKTIVSCGWDNHVRSWSQADGKMQAEFAHQQSLCGIGYQGTKLVATSWDGSSLYLDTLNLSQTAESETRSSNEATYTMAAASTGKILATAGKSNRIFLWMPPE